MKCRADGEENLDAAITEMITGLINFEGCLDRALVRRTPTPTDSELHSAAAKHNYNLLLVRRALVHHPYS